MTLAIQENPMARKKTSKPEPRKDTTVKINQDVAALARMVASSRGVSLAEYLSGIVEPIARRDLESEYSRRQKSK